MGCRNYVAMAGSIGVGKSTLARIVAEALGAELIVEDLSKIGSLDLFYGDPATYALEVQMQFLLSESRSLRTADIPGHTDTVFVSDFFFGKERLFSQINIGPADLVVYRKHFDTIAPKVPQPGTIVHLRAPGSTLLERIARRGKTYEAKISEDYLRKVSDGYRKLLTGFEGVVEFDTGGISLEADTPRVGELIELLKSRSKDRSRNKS